MIRSEVAFKQRYDTEPLNSVQKSGTDIDWMDELPNGVWVVHEWKKKTENHKPEDIITTPQWNTIRRAAGNTGYAIYSTHDEEISDKLIPADKLTVRYVELNGQAVAFKEGILLCEYLNKLGSRNAYYIIVTYPETDTHEMAIKSPAENQNWSINIKLATSNQCIFKTEDDCKEYIKKRYEKDFNQKNIYSIYHIDQDGNKTLIHKYTYPETIGL